MKPTSKIAAALIASALVSVPVSMQFIDQSPTPIATIDGPQEAAVGELIRLGAEGEKVVWHCLPHTEDYQVYGDHGESLAISFREKGVYTVIAATLNDSELALSTIEVRVGQGPRPPTPGPTPDPGVNDALASQVFSWCQEAGPPKSVAAQLGANFAQVADEIESGVLQSTSLIIKRTYELNRKVDLTGFQRVIGKINAHIISESEAGRLATPAQHRVVWVSIAEGLKRYAE